MIDGFEPARASFISEGEFDHILSGGPGISEGKLKIYSYFIQGHNAKECADFLRETYGSKNFKRIGYGEWYDSKGVHINRSDDFTQGYYAEAVLNWSQVQKRVRSLIDTGRYLNEQEKNYLPEYDKLHIARSIYAFQFHDPQQSQPGKWDAEAAKRDILPLLDSPEQVEKIFNRMLSGFASLSPDTPHYTEMQLALRDVGMYQRGESPLFAPLPEAALEAERQKKQAEKEARRKTPASQRTTSEAPPASGDRLAAAARALAKKRPAAAQEDQSGQFSLFSMAEPVSLEPETPAPAPEPAAPSQEAEHEETSRSPWWDGYNEIKEANPNNIVLFQVGDFYEMFGEDAKDDAFSMTVMGQTFTERKAAGEAIINACLLMGDPEKPLDLGEYRGFPMQLHCDGSKFRITMKQNLTYTAELADDPVGNISRINNALEGMEDKIKAHETRLATLEKELVNAQEEAERPFPKEDELREKSARLTQLNRELENPYHKPVEQSQDS